MTRGEAYHDCMRYFCCYALRPDKLLEATGFTEAGTMDQPYMDKSVNLTAIVSLCYVEGGNMTKAEMLEAAGCNTVACKYHLAVDRELSELEYGWGLFQATGSFQQMSAGSKRPADERECVGWCHRNRYEFEPTLFLMVSYLVMLVVSFNEVRQALHLLVYAAAAAGALPSFYTPVLWQQGKVPCFHCDLSQGSVCFIMFAPVLQLLVAFVVMCCGGGLLLITDQQNSRASIIFNAVALAFIVEIDDRIGLIMRMQQPWMPQRDRARPSDAAGTVALYRPWTGHAVFGIVGLLLLSHSLLVAPQTPAQVLAFFTTTWAYIVQHKPAAGASVLRDWSFNDNWRDGMTYNFFLDPTVRAGDYIDMTTIWNIYAFWGFAGLCSRLTDKNDQLAVPISRSGAIVMCSMYLLVAVFMVLLLCHSLLPSKAIHWRWVLTCVQVVLVVVAQLQYLTWTKNVPEVQTAGRMDWVSRRRTPNSDDPMEVQRFGFLVVLSILFVSWLAMFVLWPFFYWARHAPDGEWAGMTYLIAAVQGWPGAIRRGVVRAPRTPSNVPQAHDGATDSKHGAKPPAPATEPSDVEGAGDQAV